MNFQQKWLRVVEPDSHLIGCWAAVVVTLGTKQISYQNTDKIEDKLIKSLSNEYYLVRETGRKLCIVILLFYQ